MYTQALNTSETEDRNLEDAARAAQFQARIDAEDRIEPNDWMPGGLSQDADAADLAARAFRDRRHAARGQLDHPRTDPAPQGGILLAKVQDEGGHGLYLYAAAETLGVSREELVDAAARRQGQIFLDLQLPDADLGGYRRDRLAGRRRGDHEPDSAVPLLVRALCTRDDPHLQGRDLPPAPGLRDHADAVRGTEEQKAMAQDALDRWWWPVLMMFGPPDKASQHSDTSTKWKIKRFSNDELRQKFVDATVPQAHYLGLSIPDPDLTLDARRDIGTTARSTGTSSTQVLAGNGPCNRDRMAARRKAHDEGAWVREAALAYAEKRAAAARGRRIETREVRMPTPNTPLWEVFIRSRNGLAHKHVGSLHAADATLALQAARDVYTRRGEGLSIWVVPSSAITASDPADKGMMFEPAEQDLSPPDVLRVPDEVGHM